MTTPPSSSTNGTGNSAGNRADSETSTKPGATAPPRNNANQTDAGQPNAGQTNANQNNAGQNEVPPQQPWQEYQGTGYNAPPTTPTMPTQRSHAGHQFFQWLRQLGLRRGSNRWIGGVCSGVANKLGWDPLLVRIMWFALCFFGGAGFALYGIAWLLLPDERDGSILVEEATFGHVTGRLIFAILLMFGGISSSTVTLPFFGVGFIVTVGLIVAAVVLLAPHKNQPPYSPSNPTNPANSTTSTTFTTPTWQNQQTTGGMPQAAVPTASVPPQNTVNNENAAWTTQAFTAPPATGTTNQSRQNQPWMSAPVAPPAATQYEIRKPASQAGIALIYGLLFLTAAAAASMMFLFPSATNFNGIQLFVLWVLAADIIVGLGLIVIGIAGRRSASVGWLLAPLLVLTVVFAPQVSSSQGNFDTAFTSTNHYAMTETSLTANDFQQLREGVTVSMGSLDIDLSNWKKSSEHHGTSCPTGTINLHATMSEVTVEIPDGCDWRVTGSQVGSTIDGMHPNASNKDVLTINGSATFSTIEISHRGK